MEPQRTCIACRRRDDQSALLRVVRRGGRLVDGTDPRLEGRGAYVHAECVDLAHKRQAFRRALGVAEVDTLPAGSAAPGAI